MKNLIKTEIIENYLQENNLSKTKFCKMCGISHSTFRKIMDNDSNSSLVALFKVVKVMKIHLYEIFR